MEPASREDVVALVDRLIRQAVQANASDVHFDPDESGLRVRFRVDGLLQDEELLPTAIAPNVTARLKVLGGLLTYRTDIPQEGSIKAGTGGWPCDIRVASFPTVRGERVVLRLMAHAHRFLKLDQLGHDPTLVERLKGHLKATQGLLIVCGPAGSGKTTTLAAMLDYLREQRPGESIITLEDPVEIRLPGIIQVQIHAERGLTYPVALRSLLRQDPQVLMIGEVRDADTAHIVVEAALTGHLMLTTIHSGTPAEAIVRLLEMGVPSYQVTSTLRGVLAQRLLRRLKPGSRREALEYSGRIACGQFVEMTSTMRSAILRGADVSELSDDTISPGSLERDADRLVSAGLTSKEEVRRVLG